MSFPGGDLVGLAFGQVSYCHNVERWVKVWQRQCCTSQQSTCEQGLGSDQWEQESKEAQGENRFPGLGAK